MFFATISSSVKATDEDRIADIVTKVNDLYTRRQRDAELAKYAHLSDFKLRSRGVSIGEMTEYKKRVAEKATGILTQEEKGAAR